MAFFKKIEKMLNFMTPIQIKQKTLQTKASPSLLLSKNKEVSKHWNPRTPNRQTVTQTTESAYFTSVLSIASRNLHVKFSTVI